MLNKKKLKGTGIFHCTGIQYETMLLSSSTNYTIWWTANHLHMQLKCNC